MGTRIAKYKAVSTRTEGIVDGGAVEKEIEEAKKTLRPKRGNCGNSIQWTEEEDRKLKALWLVCLQVDVAKNLGYNVSVCRSRYRELMGL
jgi:hypothetical protein